MLRQQGPRNPFRTLGTGEGVGRRSLELRAWSLEQGRGSGLLQSGEPQIVSSETFSPAVVKGANTFAFAYTGDGSAVLQRFAHFDGTMLIFN